VIIAINRSFEMMLYCWKSLKNRQGRETRIHWSSLRLPVSITVLNCSFRAGSCDLTGAPWCCERSSLGEAGKMSSNFHFFALSGKERGFEEKLSKFAHLYNQ
jgi:hypothetical protein